MRILKFIGVFLATLLIVFLIVFGFSLDALFTLFENREGLQEGQEWVAKTSSLKGLTEYMGAQPEHVSVASIAIDNPDSSILYNEHTPRTMGQLSAFFLITEFARQVEQGELNPDDPVSLDEVNQYQLPFIDASSHQNALASMADNGKIRDANMVTIADIAEVATEFNDLAATDFLLFTLGRQNIDQLMDKLALTETESILPFSGLYITLHPHLHNTSFEEHLDSLSHLSRPDFEDLVWDNARRFTSDSSFRTRVLNQFQEHSGLGVKFTQERDILNLFPKTTALEMVSLMQRVYQDNLISAAVSQHLKEIMSWPLNINKLNDNLKAYGAMYDNRIGMANGVDFGTSTYSSQPFAQAVFFDNLPIAFWFHMSSNLMHHDYIQRLIWDPALREATESEVQADN